MLTAKCLWIHAADVISFVTMMCLLSIQESLHEHILG